MHTLSTSDNDGGQEQDNRQPGQDNTKTKQGKACHDDQTEQEIPSRARTTNGVGQGKPKATTEYRK